MPTMRFIDLAAQQKRIRKSIETRIQAVLDHGQYIMGPEVKALESALAKYTGVSHALSCSSGTDALLLALMACGVEPGDAVFTTPFTFMATAEVVSLLRATPVFVDVDPVTYNIDPNGLERAVEALERGDASIHPLPEGGAKLRPRGVIAVDLFGLPADYARINAVAKKHGLFVIQDAAQSFGAERFGRKSCSMADIGCTSFFPAKPLGGYGDGGMCFTEDPGLLDAMASFRVHGQGHDKYENIRIGINGRLDTLQAAVLLSKFELFEEEMLLRRQVAERYDRLLNAKDTPVVTPRIPEGCLSAWAQYTVAIKDAQERPAMLQRLQDVGVPTAIYYPKPLHLQKAFGYLGYGAGDFPVSESLASRVFSLPMHPYLEEADQARIAAVVTG
ncbi:MAG: DegT/DnrJ/EryC1/StrS family aminotransferase [Syntrophobacteraceae bacterium]